MFERYTERARRVIFFGRYEASRFGSMTIETEHLLLGLLREDKDLFQRYGSDVQNIRQKIEEQIPAREKTSTSIDLPLSNECKRILAYANEESERMGHRFIGTEHLLLGILQESASLAAGVLREAGIQSDPLREAIAKSVPEGRPLTAEPPAPAPADRLSVHALVDRLAEDRLGWLKAMIENLLAAAPYQRPGFLEQEVIRAHGSAPGDAKEGRFSSSQYSEDGALVVETHQRFGGHQITVKEQFRLSDDGKKLFYSLKVAGPNRDQQHEHSIEFNVGN